MRKIRPSQLFRSLKTSCYFERITRLLLPAGDIPHADPMLLESAVLLTLSRLVNARTVFEFGTFMGVQTLNLAMNLPESSRVFTLDLDWESFQRGKTALKEGDRNIAALGFKEEAKLAFIGTPYEGRITRLLGDSTQFDFSEFVSKVDLVYVDGGHDLRTARSDTENALKMLPRESPGCIAWHDYSSPRHEELTDYLDDLSDQLDIYHVAETMICFYLKNLPADRAVNLD